jgi:hypothetical protein
MKTFSHLWHNLAEIVEKLRTLILYSVTFFRKSYRLWDNVEKYGGAREFADDDISRCMLDN